MGLSLDKLNVNHKTTLNNLRRLKYYQALPQAQGKEKLRRNVGRHVNMWKLNNMPLKSLAERGTKKEV